MTDYAGNIPDAVARRIGNAFRLDLLDGGRLPPFYAPFRRDGRSRQEHAGAGQCGNPAFGKFP